MIREVEEAILESLRKGMSELYLFSWDEVPGNDNGRLIDFLKKNLGIDWIKTVNIEKIHDGMTIRVSTEKNFLSLKLNNEKTNVNLEIDDGRTVEFIAKAENDKLNIYSELIPAENIMIGELDTNKTSISLINTGFTIEELGIGGSGGVKQEEVIEKFHPNGKTEHFNLSKKPLRPLIRVENPIGTVKNEPDDYIADYESGKISFRSPPEKGKESVQVKYQIARTVGETRKLKFMLVYSISVWADDLQEKNLLTLEVIKALYRERNTLINSGIDEMKLIKGYSADARKASIVEYHVETTIQIEMPLPPIERIEIGKIGR